MSHHTQEWSPLVGAHLDTGIRSLVEMLSIFGVTTTFSCEGSQGRCAYISMRDDGPARAACASLERILGSDAVHAVPERLADGRCFTRTPGDHQVSIEDWDGTIVWRFGHHMSTNGTLTPQSQKEAQPC